jgi:opacity protein-like surface antigen
MRIANFLLLFGLATGGSLFAQYGEFGVHGGIFRLRPNSIGSLTSGGQIFDQSLDNGWMFGLRTTLNQGAFFGHEFGYQYSRTALSFATGGSVASSGGMAIHRGTYNFLGYLLPEGTRIRPFATGGVHFANFVPPGASASRGGGENKFGINYGAGIKVRVTDRWLVRLDVREFNQGRPFQRGLINGGGRLRQQEYSVGVSFTL